MPDAAAGRHLAERRREPRRAQVLQRGQQPAVEQVERALDQLLAGERVADLHARPLVRRALVEALRGQHGGAADAVAAGLRPVEHDQVARAGGLRARQLLGGQQADAHRVDQRVVLVGVVELDLAAHVGHADAVAVGANTRHHAREQVPLAVVVQLAEAQRVEDRDRPRAHREDVAEDAADAGRRALERLDRGRVVVALDLEGNGEPVTHVDHAGVLARALEHALAGRREPAEQQPRVLVAAVLAPEQRVDGQLEVVRIAAQQLLDTPELPVGQPEGAMQRLWRDGIQGLRNATPRGRSTGYTATG